MSVSSRSRRIGRVVFALVLAVAVLAPAGASVAVAQEDGATPTPTPVEDEQDEEQESDEPTSVEAQVDDRLRINSYRYVEDSETFYLVLSNSDERRGGSTSTVTITEAIEPTDSGTGSFGIERVRVEPGETIEVAVSVSAEGVRGVMVTSESSIEEGTGTYLAVDAGGLSILDGPATGADVRSAGLSTLLAALLVAILGAWHYVSLDNQDVEEQDLDVSETAWGSFDE
jgi:hypothetical protein